MRTLLNKSFVLLMLLIIGACGKVSPTPPPTSMPGTLIPTTAAPTNQSSDTPAPYPYPIPSQPNNPTPSLLPLLSPFPFPLPSPTISPTTQSAPSFQIFQLRMFDVNTGWAMLYSTDSPSTGAMDYKVLRTSDGIQSWANVSPPVSSRPLAYFVDENTAIAVYARSLMPESVAVEVTGWRTTDSGKTWQAGEILSLAQGGVSQVMMLNPEHGWMMSNDPSVGSSPVILFETQDGGMHWQTIYNALNSKSPDSLWVAGFYPYSEHFTFISETTGFFSSGRLFISRDGGKSWLDHPLDPPVDFPDIDCKSGSNECKYLNTVSTPQFTSTNDGVLMRRVYSNTEDVSLVFLYNASTVHLPLPIAQYLYYTHDGGQTWVPRPSPAKIGTVHFLNAQTGWLLGKSDPDPYAPTQLYRTTNGGETWMEISSNSLLPLGSDLQFVNEETGFAFEPSAVSTYYQNYDSRVNAGISPSIFYTDDGGRSWVKVEPQLTP